MYMKVSTLLLLIFTGTTAFSQEMPTFSSDQEKEAWIKANPVVYQKMVTDSEQNYQANGAQSVAITPTKVDLPGFPEYVNTGDQAADEATYAAKKEAWYKANNAETNVLRIYTPEEEAINNSLMFAGTEQVRSYMREVLSLELPANYVIPAYIKNAKDLFEANAAIGRRYPEFNGKSGIQLINATKEYPALYSRMIMEFKAVRSIFEPNN